MINKIYCIIIALAITFTSAYAYADDNAPRHKYLGIQFDTSFPDGLALGLNVRPVNWMRLTASGTHNGSAPGMRGGITLDPINFGIGLSLTLEAGHAFEGQVPGLKNSPEFGYNYVNLHPGLEFGSRNNWRIFIHGGPSWLWVRTRDFASLLNIKDRSIFVSDPHATGLINPTLKIGFAIYF